MVQMLRMRGVGPMMGYPVESLAPLAAATRRQIPARETCYPHEPVISKRTTDRGSFDASALEIEGPYPW